MEVVRVENLRKIYQIYNQPTDRLKEAFSLSHKHYGREFYALDDINFSVNKGETIGIIGENGAGKSTLLKILTGVLKPTSGEVVLNGKVSALLELGIGFNPEYTGIENIYLSGTVFRLSKAQMEEKLKQIIEFADIGDFINQKVKTYSSGMFARLAFAVAINVDPEILIVDEALAVGDLFFQQKCNMYMKEVMKDCTKILVTHDMATIGNMADKAIVLSKGKLVFSGDPLAAIEYYTKKAHTDIYKGNNSETSINMSHVNNDCFKEWNKIEDTSLGGALDVTIDSFNILINNTPYVGYIKQDEIVKIQMEVRSKRNINNVLIGYQFKDKYGNVIFGENTKSSGFADITMHSKTINFIEIKFKWPQVQKNTYFLTLGIGEGKDSMQHIIQCWAHNIFEFNNITNLPDHGIFNNQIIDFTVKEVD
ncbi:MAG: ABC transporter ATP-binding protein [Velocimicrobium sp.]